MAMKLCGAFSTPVVLWLGRDFFVNAWKQAKHRKANMDTLVALSTGIAYVFSVFNMLFADFWHQRGLHAHVYFEAAAVIIALSYCWENYWKKKPKAIHHLPLKS